MYICIWSSVWCIRGNSISLEYAIAPHVLTTLRQVCSLCVFPEVVFEADSAVIAK